jgi:hypothetical protein
LQLASVLLLCALLVGPLNSGASVTPGIRLNAPGGFYVYNIDPTLNSTDNGPIYDPNFIPGFQAGLTNISIAWENGTGYGRIAYSVGPWKSLQVGMPHLAVGPQCCNFMEIPRTQQFRRVEWGDYYSVKAGFLPPAVNMPNYTTDFSAPAYVGLRTDWEWTVSISLDWHTPILLNPANEWAAIGLSITEYVPNAPKKLVYSVLNFWMDSNSSGTLADSPSGSSGYMIVSPQVVVYNLLQFTETGNQTITINISPYLDNTLRVLNLTTPSPQPPVISYVYLNVEGYNMGWNSTLYSFFVMTNQTPSTSNIGPAPNPAYFFLLVIMTLIVILYFQLRVRKKAIGA